jgi:amino acid transporter
VTALSLVSLFTILNMALMTLSRVLYVIARDADVPYLSRVAENGTPIVAACVMVVAEALLAAFLYESPLTVLQATALLVVLTGAVAVATRRWAGRSVTAVFDAGA